MGMRPPAHTPVYAERDEQAGKLLLNSHTEDVTSVGGSIVSPEDMAHLQGLMTRRNFGSQPLKLWWVIFSCAMVTHFFFQDNSVTVPER